MKQELIKCSKCFANKTDKEINYYCDMLNAANLIAVCNVCFDIDNKNFKQKKGGD